MPFVEFVQNTTIEERVALLEIQVVDLDEDVDFLFDEQVIQDEKLLNLEQETDEINGQLVIIDDEFDIIDDELESKLKFKTSDHPCQKPRCQHILM